MKKFFEVLLLVVFSAFFFSCTPDWEENIPDVSHIEVNFEIERADRALVNAKSREEIIGYLRKHVRLATDGLSMDFYPSQDVFVESVWLLAESPKIDTLQQTIEKVYGEDLGNLKKDLTSAFRFLKYYYPDFTIPKIYTVNTGFGISIVQNDSIIVIGLDYFLGRNIQYRPVGPDRQPLPEYIARRFQPESITHQIVKLISRKYVKSSDDATLLNDMIAAGKTMYFCKHIQPYAPDSLILEYTQEQVNACFDNAGEIWGHFVEKKVFYDATRMAKTKYLQDRPFVSDISQECPGRVGYWVGWQIVDAYMLRNPQVTFQELMSDTDFQKIFQQSKYKPPK
jgi:hypothetical protein